MGDQKVRDWVGEQVFLMVNAGFGALLYKERRGVAAGETICVDGSPICLFK